MEIEFPWPYKGLSPNKRVHWYKKASVFKKYKNDCRLLALGKIPNKERIHLTIEFYPPDKRIRDVDNLLASCKAMIDGISAAWGIDDCNFRPITIDIKTPVKHGKVMVRY